MTERSDFTGLYGRQSTIAELEIPQWVTIYIDTKSVERRFDIDNVDFTESTPLLNGIKTSVLANLIEGLAIAGVYGVSIVLDTTIANWSTCNIEPFINEVLGFVRKSRPSFQAVICNKFALESTEEVVKGPVIAFIENDSVIEEIPFEKLNKDLIPVIFVNSATSMILKCNQTDAVNMIPAVFEVVPEVQRHRIWADDPFSRKLLSNMIGTLVVNTICKPSKTADRTFFTAADFMNEVTAQAFNDRSLRIRSHKESV